MDVQLVMAVAAAALFGGTLCFLLLQMPGRGARRGGSIGSLADGGLNGPQSPLLDDGAPQAAAAGPVSVDLPLHDDGVRLARLAADALAGASRACPAEAMQSSRILAAVLSPAETCDQATGPLAAIAEAKDPVAAMRAVLLAGDLDDLLTLPPRLRAYAPATPPWSDALARLDLCAAALTCLARAAACDIAVATPLTALSRADPRAVREDPRGLARAAEIRTIVAERVLKLTDHEVLVVDVLSPGILSKGRVLRPERIAVHVHAAWNG